jgi:hypothetical protein
MPKRTPQLLNLMVIGHQSSGKIEISHLFANGKQKREGLKVSPKITFFRRDQWRNWGFDKVPQRHER